MKFYIHPINPHYSATHADDFFLGWRYGIWEHPFPALEPCQYRFQSKHLDAARDTCAKAEDAARLLPDEPVCGAWVSLPAGTDPHSVDAAELLTPAALGGRPVKWPWTEVAAIA
ncbi:MULTISPECIES: hypothetical protein [unclassified Variovorax]|uniref:hypothetical protein n=1 Tax=unclassified Variovorax TaxID=663243 RepID=UPI0008398593|nr:MULTISPECIES: hypothetical protein [unclassified Variovorax]PNG49823.1 hypothetical protein CHC06_05404 [Variovorax sp. B2]PNG50695.1 hypothetical protein CHC07_05309 [Variovorax sp. B4]VTV17888.1 hypothetical protein WDL1P1_00742 [Variovorax sp. WDL1]